MITITTEEYRYLQELGYPWKWLARDRDGSLYAFANKPAKFTSETWGADGNAYIGINDDLFQFILWEDSEPVYIEVLTLMYENQR